jgi:beta-N-acetylhexosaminidase
MKPVIFGLSGPELTPDERTFFRRVDPVGFVLFKRNCVDPVQLRALTDSLRDTVGRADVPVMTDQEGGRVARMVPPAWPVFPSGEAFDRVYEIAPMSAIQAARANGLALGLMLSEAGINVNLAPLLDVRRPETTAAIGDRSYGSDPMRVAALGRALLEGMAAGGVLGVVKHMPGHGRATMDTHVHLPSVSATEEDLEADLAPFRTLAAACPFGMTSHVLYRAWDAERPATLSRAVVEDVIRGRIGFDGFLMSDDIDMKALSGTPADKAAGAIVAGCDAVLDCWARMDEMVAIADRLDPISDVSAARLERALATRREPAGDMAEATARRDSFLALAEVVKDGASA